MSNQNLLNKATHKAFVQEVASLLKKTGEVRISGLGKFVVKQLGARNGVNPKTGEAIKIPARRKVAFRVSKKFKELVLSYDLH